VLIRDENGANWGKRWLPGTDKVMISRNVSKATTTIRNISNQYFRTRNLRFAADLPPIREELVL